MAKSWPEPPVASTTADASSARLGTNGPGPTARKLDAGHTVVTYDEIARGPAFQNLDRWRGPHRCGKRRHDGAASSVSLDVKNAASAVGCLAAKIEMAFEVLVEGDAVAKQILDPVAGLTREQQVRSSHRRCPRRRG